MEFTTGQTLDKYTIETKLGEGGMGTVYLARDGVLRRPVAIKVMHDKYASESDLRQRFVREARAAANLDHPHIVKVLDFGAHNEMPYLVMAYIDGPTLRTVLNQLRRQRKQVPWPELLQLYRQLAAATAYVHEEGLLHRDLKPANVLLKRDRYLPESATLPYQPVIADWGLVKLADSEFMTQPNHPVGGTPGYMAPELAQGQAADERSDVYALGVIFYELATGARPKDQGVGLRQARPDLPVALVAIIQKACALDPATRYPSATALATALAAVPALPKPRLVAARPPQRAGFMALLGVSLIAALLIWRLVAPTQIAPSSPAVAVSTAATVALEAIAELATATAAESTMPVTIEPTTTPGATEVGSVADQLGLPPTATLIPLQVATIPPTASPTAPPMIAPLASSNFATVTPLSLVRSEEETLHIDQPFGGAEVHGVIEISWQGAPPSLAGNERLDVVRWLKDRDSFLTGQGFVDVNTITGSAIRVDLDALGLQSDRSYAYAVVVVTMVPQWRIVRRVSNIDSFYYKKRTDNNGGGSCVGPACR